MSTIKAIRQRLKLSQAALAEGLGCTQGNVWHYERPDKPQTVPPEVAKRLIDVAAGKGLHITLDQVYERVPLPFDPAEEAATEKGADT
jgi:putative transcriptional regulator